ncbi:glycosyltransferase family 39 protein [Pseudorhodoplanes sinuspersici]|uniref:Glycosyltransferase RgtA/B/C/D-like domain-containing protein n=1 Tax=Pseudorhodoplanes sinuspersici TaxID=1235591 RepID=A0A1W7A0D0_9HYPH|nr:glycosyltransferase family 39 protein [Pseudorhodoplanes sinuspersici]ARQ03054.1 hypothetical protein CAK95_18780 [Pseudorhodoplanes sinuspersici]
MSFSATRALDAAAWAILLAVVLIAYLTFDDYGLGWDDYTHSQYGQLLLDYYASGLTDTRALSFVNLYMYGGGFDMLAALIAKLLPYDLFETRRLVGAAVGIIGLFVIWRLARRIGGPVAGLIALALLATTPLYYGHIFINAKDAPFAVAMAVLLFGLVRLLEDYPKPRPVTVLIFALGLGLTLGTRIMGGMAALYMVLPMALLIVHDMRADGAKPAAVNFGAFLLRLLPGFLLAYAVMAVIWPWCIREPLNPIRAVGYFSHFFEKPWKEMFDGQLISVPDMPRSYLPTLFGLKLTEILLLLGIPGLIAGIGLSVRHDIPVRRRATMVLLAGAFAIPIGITIITRPALYNGIRHFIFVLPPLTVLGGLAGAWLLHWLAERSRLATAVAAVVMVAGFAVPAVDMVGLHPYQYTHYNRVSGGMRGANHHYMLDYWGLSFKEAADQLLTVLEEKGIATPEGRRWVIAVCGPHPPAEAELGSDFVITWNTKGADFALMLGEFYCAELNAPELVKIERDGVVFARVYDIRGRNIPSLFTEPPITH